MRESQYKDLFFSFYMHTLEIFIGYFKGFIRVFLLFSVLTFKCSKL